MSSYPKQSEALGIFKHLFATKLSGQDDSLLWKTDVLLFLEALSVPSEKSTDLKVKILDYVCKLVILSMCEDIKLDYAIYDDMYDLLDAIDGRFNKLVLTQIIGFKRKLYCQNFTNVTDLITETNKIILQLKKLSQPITDKEVAHIILATLPQSYESFISSLEMDTELKVIQQRLLHMTSLNENIEESTMYVKKDYSKRPSNIGTKKCYNCRGFGHFAHQCPSKKYEHRTQYVDDYDSDEKENNADEYFGVFTIVDNEWICNTILDKGNSNLVILDSGSSVHAFSNLHFLKNIKNIPPKILKTADGSKVQVNKAGTLSLLGQELHDVLYVPQFHTNLLSLGKLLQNFNLVKTDGNLYLKSSNINIPVLTINNMLTINLQQDVCLNLTKCDDTDLFHKRFGHTNLKSMEKTLAIKICRITHPLNLNTTKIPLHTICADLAEPKCSKSIYNIRYYLIVLDIATKVTVVKAIKSKSDTFNALCDIVNDLENSSGFKVKFIHTDNGLEFCNKNVINWARSKGIVRTTTIAHTPEANPVERYNRTLKNMCGVILYDQMIDAKLWPFIIEACSHIRNRIYNDIIQTTPLSALGIKNDVQHLRILGSLTFIRKPTNRDLTYRSDIGSLVGFDRTKNSYLVYLFYNQKVIKCCDVIIDETRNFKEAYTLYKSKLNVESDDLPDLPDQKEDIVPLLDKNITIDKPSLDLNISDNDSSDNIDDDWKTPRLSLHPNKDISFHSEMDDLSNLFENSFKDKELPPNNSTDLRKSTYIRDPKPIEGVGIYKRLRSTSRNVENVMFTSSINVPNSPDEAMDNHDWKLSMTNELQTILENKTWNIIPKSNVPTNAKIIKSKWVFTVKSNGLLKSRLTARGDQQISNPFTFAPTATCSTVKLILSHIINENLNVIQLDVVGAFLNGTLPSPEYMELPVGIELIEKDKTDDSKYCLQLVKSLYGLKQAARQWYLTFTEKISELGFVESELDSSLYILKENINGKDTTTWLLLYVDDSLLTSTSQNRLVEIKEYLMNKFIIKDLGNLENSEFVGLQISRGENVLKLHQYAKIHCLINEFSSLNILPQNNPCNENILDFADSKPLNPSQHNQFRSLLGRLLYISRISRMDINYVINSISSYQAAPKLAHLKLLTGVIGYLTKHPNYYIEFKKNDYRSVIEIYSDANFSTSGKSTSGILVFHKGNLIHWSSSKQDNIAISTFESEFYACIDAIKFALWIKKFFDYDVKPIVYVDNLPVIQSLEKDGARTSKARHFQVKFEWLKKSLSSIDLQHKPTSEQLADFLTKLTKGESLRKLLIGEMLE
uniref:Retrovirus-related Pol polyprotein from transposon TNT 1-94 n=1 Tax=Strongyloides papillosus TaxID=174720 RepID=A0A0N5CAJ0_STREA